jgi:protein O-GlcNAc transferase
VPRHFFLTRKNLYANMYKAGGGLPCSFQMGYSLAKIDDDRYAMFPSQSQLDVLLQTALTHHQAGRFEPAEALYRQVLHQDPQHMDALQLLGVLAGQAGQLETAVQLLRQAIAIDPGYYAAHSNIAGFLRELGQFDEAVAACNIALSLNPDCAAAHFNLGEVLRQQDQWEAAAGAYREALRCQGNFPEALLGLATVHDSAGRLPEALAYYRAAVTQNPRLVEGHYALGTLLWELGQFSGAAACFRQTLALDPAHVGAHCGLARTLQDAGQFEDALAFVRQVFATHAERADLYDGLAMILSDAGWRQEALAAYRRAAELDPKEHSSNLLLVLHYDAQHEPQTIAEKHRAWGRCVAESLKQARRPHGNARDPERRLRLGYVSPDFRNHAVAPMVLPLLEHHDHAQFEIFCYAQVPRPDAMTEQFKRCADQWRSTVTLSDEQLAELVRQDGIDILIDLAGHTGGNRLRVFARKPAPVQVARQGYPDTTGLDTIDYRMTDALADPPGLADAWHTEKLLRLPRTNWIYKAPPEAVALAVAPLEADGPITFGCFNNFAKVTDPMLHLWAQILAAVPGSRILLKAKALAVTSVRQRVAGIFAQHDISAERLEMKAATATAAEHLQHYRQVAIALDPFPYHGTTTTCEALWMGVPVITLAGQTHVARVGVSLLTNVGTPELIAQTSEEYVRIAVALASDHQRLVELHATLRQKLQSSPIMDHAAFARNIEAAYRQMWRTWCASPS